MFCSGREHKDTNYPWRYRTVFKKICIDMITVCQVIFEPIVLKYKISIVKNDP